MKSPIRIDYILFFAGLSLGLFGCIEVHFAATGIHSPPSGALGYILLAVGTGLFLGGMWLLAKPGSAAKGPDNSDLALLPGPTLITAAIGRLGTHLRNGEALWTRLALVGAGAFLNAVWISWLLDGLHRLPAKENPRAFLWGACMQLGITCFMWVSIKPTPRVVEGVSPEDEALQENRSSEKAS
jgi:hypothetical protein